MKVPNLVRPSALVLALFAYGCGAPQAMVEDIDTVTAVIGCSRRIRWGAGLTPIYADARGLAWPYAAIAWLVAFIDGPVTIIIDPVTVGVIRSGLTGLAGLNLPVDARALC